MNGSHLAIGAAAALVAAGALSKRGSPNQERDRWAIIDQGPRNDEAFVRSLIKAVPFDGGLVVGRTREGVLLPLDFSFGVSAAMHLLREGRARARAGSALLVPLSQKSIEVIRSNKAEDEPAGTFMMRLIYNELPARDDQAILAEHLGSYFVATKADRSLSERWHEAAPWSRWRSPT